LGLILSDLLSLECRTCGDEAKPVSFISTTSVIRLALRIAVGEGDSLGADDGFGLSMSALCRLKLIGDRGNGDSDEATVLIVLALLALFAAVKSIDFSGV